MSPCCYNNLRPIKLQFPLFLATVLTNKLVILTILFLQCKNTLIIHLVAQPQGCLIYQVYTDTILFIIKLAVYNYVIDCRKTALSHDYDTAVITILM